MESRLTDGLFGLQQRGIVVWRWDEVRGRRPEGPRQKPDHNRGLIIMRCCRAPAGTPPSRPPAGLAEQTPQHFKPGETHDSQHFYCMSHIFNNKQIRTLAFISLSSRQIISICNKSDNNKKITIRCIKILFYTI